MSIYRELLTIKNFRENRAELAVIDRRHAVAKAQADEAAKRKSLEEFDEFVVRREASLYRELCSRIVGLRDLEEVQNVVVELRVQKEALERELDAAGNKRRQEIHLLSEAQTVHKGAVRIRQKFVELAQDHADDLALEAERKEDLELEEVASFGHPKNAGNHVELEDTNER